MPGGFATDGLDIYVPHIKVCIQNRLAIKHRVISGSTVPLLQKVDFGNFPQGKIFDLSTVTFAENRYFLSSSNDKNSLLSTTKIRFMISNDIQVKLPFYVHVFSHFI